MKPLAHKVKKIKAPIAPIKTGWTFAYYSNQMGLPTLVELEEYMLSQNTDFVYRAVYSPNQYILTFQTNGGSLIPSQTKKL